MCGIVGFQGPPNEALLESMNACVRHRGPDGDGLVTLSVAEGVANSLAHRRLAIIDLSPNGAQPMTIDCDVCGVHGIDQLALVFNGEIYNYPGIRERLVGEGHTFSSESDSEVLLHLYAELGPGMLDELNGIFALAVHDGRLRGHGPGIAQGDLFIARDQMGVKPLYYAALEDRLLFASELKALLQDPGLPRDLDALAIHQYLTFLWTPGERTPLLAVRKLGAGCALIVRNGRIQRHWRYWDPPASSGEAFEGTAEALYAALRGELEAAVRRQLVSDVPVGAFLSGGLDSSTIVAMMRKISPDASIRAYCIGAGDGALEDNPDDVPYARRVAKHLNVDLEVMEIDAGIADRLEEMIFLLDEPQADPAPLNALLIAERARADGYKVLLSGAGGDDLFSGYRRHAALQYESAWSWLPSGVRRPVARVARSIASGKSRLNLTSPLVRRGAKALSYADADGDARIATYFWWNTPELRRSLLGPRLREALAGDDPSAPMLESLSRLPSATGPLDRMLFLEQKHFLTDHNLNYTDRMGMAAGVEVRVPLIDLELVRFAARIPAGAKQDGTLGKAVLKRSMEPLLPRDVIYRKKTGFGAPLRKWLRGELRDRLEDTLGEASLSRRGLFDPAGVRSLIELNDAGRVDGSYTLFAMMCIELWCRQFIDVTPSPAVIRVTAH